QAELIRELVGRFRGSRGRGRRRLSLEGRARSRPEDRDRDQREENGQTKWNHQDPPARRNEKPFWLESRWVSARRRTVAVAGHTEQARGQFRQTEPRNLPKPVRFW